MAAATGFDYATWADFRFEIRKYLRVAEAAAREIGLEPQQHQLLLTVRGFPGPGAPTIGEVAERMQIRHHSTVELVDRMEAGGLVARRPAPHGRAVRVVLTPQGRRSLDGVSRRLEPELSVAASRLIQTLSHLLAASPASARKAGPRTAPAVRRAAASSSDVTVRSRVVPARTTAPRPPAAKPRASAARPASKPRSKS